MCAGCLIRHFGSSSGTHFAMSANAVATVNTCPLLLNVHARYCRQKVQKKQAKQRLLVCISIIVSSINICPIRILHVRYPQFFVITGDRIPTKLTDHDSLFHLSPKTGGSDFLDFWHLGFIGYGNRVHSALFVRNRSCARHHKSILSGLPIASSASFSDKASISSNLNSLSE